MSDTDAGTLRLDKWLWQARFYKTRSLAAQVCARGIVRLNRRAVDRAHAAVRPGDVLTLPLAGGRVRVVRVLALGERRGPATEARLLYEEVEAPP